MPVSGTEWIHLARYLFQILLGNRRDKLSSLPNRRRLSLQFGGQVLFNAIRSHMFDEQSAKPRFEYFGAPCYRSPRRDTPPRTDDGSKSKFAPQIQPNRLAVTFTVGTTGIPRIRLSHSSEALVILQLRMCCPLGLRPGR